MGQGTTAAIETAATAAVAAAPLPHCRTAGGLVWGPLFALCGGRLLGRICLFFGLMCSFLVRWPRTVDYASGGLDFRRLHARLCVPFCVRL